ncbi:unnamed protein product, partial [Aphanomyces euteiches]
VSVRRSLLLVASPVQGGGTFRRIVWRMSGRQGRPTLTGSATEPRRPTGAVGISQHGLHFWFAQ